MRIIICCFTVFLSIPSFAQSIWTDAFSIKKTFNVGESKSYEVNEFFKIDNLFLMIRSEVNSTVNFQVIDTAEAGYWLSYTVNTNSVKQHNDSSAYIIAQLMNGLQLYVYLKNGHSHLDSLVYFKVKKRIEEEVNSMAVYQKFGKKNTQFIQYLQNELKKDEGLGFLLGPLALFESYYSSNVYKKFRITTEGKEVNILKKILFGGIISQKWQSTTKDSTVKLNYFFTGDPVPAARYYKSIYEPLLIANNIKRGKYFYPAEMRYIADYTFHSRPGRSFPLSLYKKVVSEYIFRSVIKIDMKELLQ